MEFLNRLNLSPKNLLKTIGLVFLGAIALMVLLALFNSFASPLIRQSGLKFNAESDGLAKGGSMEMSFDSAASTGLSARNIMPETPASTGADAEDYEVTEYYARIETRNLEQTCSAVSGIKAKDYVIFESANEYDTGCSYFFKVKKENRQEIIDLIESLKPKDLAENTQTIKRLIDDYTSEEEILNKKLETVDETLNSAITAYDEIARVATQARDAESLAKIIDSKIRIIENLSQQKIDITAQLDRLARSKAEQLDRLEYIYFRVNIYESKYIDGQQLKDSWKNELKEFVRNFNAVIQKSSIGLVLTIFLILQYSLYILLIAIVAKLGWKILKKIWGKQHIN